MEFTNVKTYRDAAEKYRPAEITLLLIAESPPWFADPKKMAYFYFENNPGNEMFFATIVKGVLGESYYKNVSDKKAFLCKLRAKNIWLTDAVEYPINKDEKGINVPSRQREQLIRDNTHDLLGRLKELKGRGIVNENTEFILIKETVYNVVKDKLFREGFDVMNEGYIAFPRFQFDPNVVTPIEELCKRV